MELIIAYFSGFWGLTELTASIISLICVYLAAKHNQWTWFFGAIGVIIFGIIFIEFKLYSDALLQLAFFLPAQVWGYYTWKEAALSSNSSTSTKSLTGIQILQTVSIVALSSLVLGTVMSSYTDASFPYADAWTTAMSVVAQILMIKKFWQSWVFWVTMDIGAIAIYALKGLYVTSGLYAIFLILAYIGLYKWYNDYKVKTI